MYFYKQFHSRVFFLILIEFFLYPSIICLLKSIKKISNNGDYLAVLESGLYIYNFENTKIKTITTFNQSIFNIRDEYNRIVISKNEDIFSNETKIATLINQHLYIYTYGNSNANLEYLLIKSFTGNLIRIFPFEIQIEGYNLSIYFSDFNPPFGVSCGELYIKILFYQNYSSIQNDQPKKISSELINAINPICQIDKKDSLIKCVCECQSCHLKFLILKKIGDNFEKLFDKRIYNYDLNEDTIPYYLYSNRISNITWSISTKAINTTFICDIERNSVYCFYNNNTDRIHFREISLIYNMRQCLEINTYFFEENNKFVLKCKKSNNSYCLYIFDGYDFNLVQNINLTTDDYIGKSYLIYNHRTNNYDIINDYILEKIFEEEQSTFETTEIFTDKITENTFKPTKEISNHEIIIKSTELYSNNYSEIPFNYFCQNIEEITQNKFESELVIPCDYYKIKFTSTYYQKKYYYNYTSIIDLGKCEEELKNYYNISNTSNLYILMVDFNLKGINHPIIEYEVFYPKENDTMEKLNLSICKNIKIELFIPVNITDDIDKHNPNSSYYNNICTKATSKSGTDIIIEDRRNEYVNNNLSLCEENCTFIEYNNNKKAKCSCEVKTFFSFIKEIKIDKDKLMKNFKYINTITNIQIVKCYKIAFSKKNIIKNYGFYILSFIVLYCFICTILFYSKFYESLIEEINIIISALKISLSKNDNGNKTKMKKRKADKEISEDEKSNFEMNFIKNIKGEIKKEITEDTKSNIETNLIKNKRRRIKKEIKDDIKSNLETTNSYIFHLFSEKILSFVWLLYCNLVKNKKSYRKEMNDEMKSNIEYNSNKRRKDKKETNEDIKSNIQKRNKINYRKKFNYK